MNSPDQKPVTVTLVWDEVLLVQMAVGTIIMELTQNATDPEVKSQIQLAESVLGKLEPQS